MLYPGEFENAFLSESEIDVYYLEVIANLIRFSRGGTTVIHKNDFIITLVLRLSEEIRLR